MPSPLKSPTATDRGFLPTVKVRAAWKDPSPLPSSTETESEPALATARSGTPSPLKSPTATERACEPVAKPRAAWKVPSPLPSSTEIEEVSKSTPPATARSGTPSPLKSPTAAEKGRVLRVAKFRAAWKVPSPLPSSTETLFAPLGKFAPLGTTARSGIPSPLRSPTATEIATMSMFGAARKDPSPLPSSTETVPEPPLTTARSRTPSPLKSPTATDEGSRPPDAKSLRPTNDTVSASAGAGSVDQQINVAATSRNGLAEFLIISSPPRARGSLSVASLLRFAQRRFAQKPGRGNQSDGGIGHGKSLKRSEAGA